MKKQPILLIGGLVALLLCLAAFLFPIAPGIVRTTNGGGIVEYFRGYDFIFTNDAAEITKEASGAMIASWVLLVIGTVFVLFGTLVTLTGSTKFSGFLQLVGGICLAVTAVFYFLAPMMAGLPAVNNASYSLGYGFIIGGATAGVGALLGIVCGGMGLFGKSK